MPAELITDEADADPPFLVSFAVCAWARAPFTDPFLSLVCYHQTTRTITNTVVRSKSQVIFMILWVLDASVLPWVIDNKFSVYCTLEANPT
jgi:hypothetical protein